MNNLKPILFHTILFLTGCVVAFAGFEYYRVFVRRLFKFFQGDHIVFQGKPFFLFPGYFFIVSFAVFLSVLGGLLVSKRNRSPVAGFVLAVIVFFLTSLATTFLDSTSAVTGCTACKDGIRSLRYNEIEYNTHFSIALALSLLPPVILIKRK